MTRRAVCDWPSLQPEDGAEPLWAEINDDLTVAEWERIPGLKDTAVTVAEVQAAIAPHVLAWNCTAVNTASGQWETVPAPAELGGEALTYVSKRITTWLWLCLKAGADLNLPKGASNGSATDGTATGKSTDQSTRGARKKRQTDLHA